MTTFSDAPWKAAAGETLREDAASAACEKNVRRTNTLILKHTTNTLNRLEHLRILNSLKHVQRLILVTSGDRHLLSYPRE
jgi:hypothetical protein